MHGQGTYYWTNGDRYEGQNINELASDGTCYPAGGDPFNCYQKSDGSWVEE